MDHTTIILLLTAVVGACAATSGTVPIESDRPRIRDLGVSPGILSPGPLNAITDVAGVRVGHITLVDGDHTRTGVTAILPHADNLYQQKVFGGVHVGNAFGKAAGFLQVQELGTIETPIVLTNTLSVGRAVAGTVRWTLDQPGNEAVRSVNAIVGETNDARLNDIRAMQVTEDHVIRAIEKAAAGPVDEGAVGAGTGTVCFGFKGGIGTSSRQLPESLGGYTVGVLVQSNFGGVLTIDGRRIGESLGRFAFQDALARTDAGSEAADDDAGDGSCMIIIATDAPLTPRQLKRLASRSMLGLARTGSFMSHGSGDFAVSFSTANRQPHRARSQTESLEFVRDERLSPLFLAVVEATEEAVYNSLTTATSMTGHQGRTVESIPIDRLRELLAD